MLLDQMIDIGRLPLAEGGVLKHCELAVATHGAHNAAKTNAILVPTWYSGTSKFMEQVDIDPDHGLDPTKHFIVVVNQIGSGLSTSPPNTKGAQTGPNFPKVRIGDVSLRAGGDKAAALDRVRVKTFAMPMRSDIFFPPTDCQTKQKLIPNSEFRPISTLDGHLALFGTDADAIAQVDRNLKELLATPV